MCTTFNLSPNSGGSRVYNFDIYLTDYIVLLEPRFKITIIYSFKLFADKRLKFIKKFVANCAKIRNKQKNS